MHTAKKAVAAAVFALSGSGFAIAAPQVPADSPALKTSSTDAIISTEAVSAKGPPPSYAASAVSTAAEPVAVLNSRSFKIPFNVDPTGSRPVEVRLYVNRGGKSEWEHFDSKPPTIREFAFSSDKDGVYLFATQTLDSSGSAHPAGPIHPQLKVVVDTTGPEMTLHADGDADGTVRCSMDIEDATAISGTRLYYASDVETQWRLIPAEPAGDDRSFTFLPKEDWRQLSIHVTAIDSAGNQTVAMKRLQRPRLAALPTNRFASSDRRDSNVPNVAPFAKPQLKAISVQHRTASTTDLYIRPAESDPTSGSNPIIKLDRKKPETEAPRIAANYGTTRSDSPLNQFRGHTPASETQHAFAQTPLTGAPPSTPNQRRIIPPANVPVLTAPAVPTIPVAPHRVSTPPSLQVTPSLQAPPRPQTPPSLQTQPTPPAASGFVMPQTTAVPRNPVRGQVAGQVGNAFPLPRYAQRPGAIELPQPATPEQVTLPFGTDETPSSKKKTGSGPALFAPATGAVPPPSTTADSTTADRPKTPAEAMRRIDNSEITKRERPIRPAPPEKQSEKRSVAVGSNRDQAQTKLAVPPTAADDRYSAQRALQSRIDSATFGGRVPTRFSDSNRFSLEYELEAVGIVGVESVELYGSTDGGKSWKFWGQDPDNASPFDIETKEEGVFGFRIVVVSSNGLTSPRPQAGESPDIVVVVDQSKPTVRISGAQYGEGDRTGSLVIRYECDDANLMTRPITLSFSDDVEGPWTTIAAGLRNDGDYVWPADPQLPRQLYLRIDATDNAGNMGSYVLDRPIDTQGLAPRARIRGFLPISGFPMPSDNEHTAARSQSAYN
ncbi:putative secreted protein [Rhodopirellula maiorica SM1]|uniref:Putative secreted protein n=1 Tax=Rhodopirellula maiorica SM1 TaxID=1265738 RepID=M5RHG2_9BACT|nr:hypothetical protein [Rhodopirellula maiorica]EMI18616.1 putative secreted protein [Rhodopirellula maiorica SM1]